MCNFFSVAVTVHDHFVIASTAAAAAALSQDGGGSDGPNI